MKVWSKDAGDLYSLQLSDLLKLERFGEKSALKLLDSLEKSKQQTFDRKIFALGIRFVGEGTAMTLSMRFASLEDLSAANSATLETIPDVGPRVSAAIIEFFGTPYAKRVLDKLHKAGFSFRVDNQVGSGNKLAGKTLVITGTLVNMSREQAERAIISEGGHASGSVSKKTDYVIVGSNPGSKYQKALDLGVPVLSEEEFLKLTQS